MERKERKNMQMEQLNQIVMPLLEWYHKNARVLPWRQNKDPYRVWVSEIMLQQTRVEAVIPYYERFMKQLPTIRMLAECDDEQLMKLWEGLGYYSRVKNLKKAAQVICNDYEGNFPQDFDLIIKLPGIGEYTAGAISSIAFEKATAAVDGNVLRVITRLTENSQDIMDTKVRRMMTKELEKVYPEKERGDFTQSLMELGAMVCVPNGAPKCEECPLNFLCGARKHQTQLQYPTKKKKAERRNVEMMVLILHYQDKIALRKRKEEGVLSGMWEFPNLEGRTWENMAQWILERNIVVDGMESEKELSAFLQNIKKGKKKHIFSHIEWHMDCIDLTCDSPGNDKDLVWVTNQQLEGEIALPAAFQKILQ